MAESRELVLGTAGHIDHGKTTLVERLTGTNTDRLDEERRRGISIELGFARLALPGGRDVGVIDVPGHRRLVRAMIAGAGGIDMFLLTIAADDGVMPQTREHWTVLRALGIERGVIALTKADAASPEAIAIAREEAEELAPGVPVVEVSARTGAGVDELAAAIAEVADSIAPADHGTVGGGPVMHLDRVFSLKGIGTVVTGTLRGGEIAVGESVRILPSERTVRVRSAQVHDRPVEVAEPGRRVALNLVGVDRDEVRRGDVLASAGSPMAASYRLDVQLGFEPAGSPRVQVHHGTRQTAARIVGLGGERLFQLRLESPLIAEPGDRVVLRRIAPPGTFGGGVVIDPAPVRHGPGPATARLEAALRGEPVAEAEASESIPAEAPEEPVVALGTDDLRVLRELDEGGLQPAGPAAIAEALGMPRPEVERSLADLARAGHVVALRGDVNYPRPRLERIGMLVAELARERGSIGLPELRDALRISRKYSQAILEHLDGTGVTVRRGERHILRRPLER